MHALCEGAKLGRYVIESPLGHGGMGAVYRARDTQLNRLVALKVTADPTNAELSRRFSREAKALAAISHPHVVNVFDVGEHEGTPYFVMELVLGSSLRARSASASMGERLRWLREVASALASVHDAGLIHRDVKPDNVVIRSDGVAKLVDFGIAKNDLASVDGSAPTAAVLSQALTGDGALVGSPAYMAPEQLRGGGVIDARTDQFAWGVLAFEILTGKLPWRQGTVFDIASSILGDEVPIDRLEASETEPWLPEVVRRTLEKQPEDRFASMHDVVASMEGRLAAGARSADGALGDTHPATVPSVTQRIDSAQTRPEATRARWPYAVLALIVGAGIAVGLLAMRKPPPAPEVLASASAAPSAPLVTPAVTPVVGPPPRPCGSAGVEPCNADNRPWCDAGGKHLVCCTAGLAATPSSRCECPVGGTNKKEMQKAGCSPPKEPYTPLIQVAMRAKFRELGRCYSAGKAHDAGAVGKLSVHFEILGDGRIGKADLVDVTLPDAALQDCLIDIVRKLELPPPPEGFMTVTYPIAFSPGEDSAPQPSASSR